MPVKDRLTAVEPAKAKLSLAPAPERRLLNRELSLIEFFRQVLEEAHDKRNPLLERLRFLTIFTSIVDEFFMVRVSGLKEEVEQGWFELELVGFQVKPGEALKPKIWQRVDRTIERLLSLPGEIAKDLAGVGDPGNRSGNLQFAHKATAR